MKTVREDALKFSQEKAERLAAEKIQQTADNKREAVREQMSVGITMTISNVFLDFN